jgi:hypothetical protein
MTEVRIARPPGSAALDAEALHDLLATSFELAVGQPRVVRPATLDTSTGRCNVPVGGCNSLPMPERSGSSWWCRVGKASSVCSPAPGRGGRRWRAPFRTGR